MNKKLGGENVQKTLKIKLYLNKNQRKLIDNTCLEYISTVNMLVEWISNTENKKITTKNFNAKLPSAVKNQCIRDARSIVKKHKNKRTKTLAVLKKPICIWNNQNFRVQENTISFPVWTFKSKRIVVKANITEKQKELLNGNLGTLRISKKNNKYIAQITVEVFEKQASGGNIMGVDLGIKVPAVAMTNTNKIKFFGNGRKNKYIKRQFKAKRKKLGKAKKLNAIKKLNDKEQRVMTDIDHKISRQIVNFAKENNVSTIRLEKLSNIRNTARTSRKNNHSLHTWSFYRLAKFIEYKANLEGIKVEYVDPKYTSQICPNCNTRNKAKDRKYRCSCGFIAHRDIVGANNIMLSTMIDGKSLSA